MKLLIILFTLVLFALQPLYAQPTIATADAPAFVGQQVKICDSVINTNALEVTDVKPTIITIGSGDVATIISIIIKAEDRRWFDYKPEKDLLNRRICVTGLLEKVNGKLQINVNKQEAIDLIKN